MVIKRIAHSQLLPRTRTAWFYTTWQMYFRFS